MVIVNLNPRWAYLLLINIPCSSAAQEDDLEVVVALPLLMIRRGVTHDSSQEENECKSWENGSPVTYGFSATEFSVLWCFKFTAADFPFSPLRDCALGREMAWEWRLRGKLQIEVKRGTTEGLTCFRATFVYCKRIGIAVEREDDWNKRGMPLLTCGMLYTK